MTLRRQRLSTKQRVALFERHDGICHILIGHDTPLRLDVAAAVEYPDGSMTASGLRRENRRGRLEAEVQFVRARL